MWSVFVRNCFHKMRSILCFASLESAILINAWWTLVVSDFLSTYSSFIKSWGMKNSGISKYWCTPISLKLPCNWARKHFLLQRNTVLWFVISSHGTSLTNKSTVLSRDRKHFLRQSNTVLWFVLSSHITSLTNENTVMFRHRNCFLAL